MNGAGAQTTGSEEHRRTHEQRHTQEQRRTHVLAMIDGLEGGAESFAGFLTRHLDPERYRRTLCVTRAVPDPESEARAREEFAPAGVELLMLRRRGRFDVEPWRVLVRYLRDERVDILHAHKFGSNVWAALLRGLARTPVVIAHEHTWSYEGQPVRKALDRHLIARRCDRFIAVSEMDRRRMVEVEHIDPRKISVVPVGIPPREPTGRDVRAELAIAADVPVVVTVAVLRPQKALEVLLAAAAELRARHPALRVLIVGDGPERARLDAEQRALALEETVTMLGVRRDVMDVLAAADVTVCCSDFEGSPQAVIEYMAAGKPVVATRVGGLPDLVADGINGLLVEPRAPTRLAAAIDRLLAEPDLAARMGQEGRERQRAELTIDVTMERIESLYSDLLASAARR